MKMNKKVFKSIVKECLVEILAEGLYPQEGDIREKKADLRESIQKRSIMGLGKMNKTQQQNVQKRQQSAGSYLDKVSFGEGQQEINPSFKEKSLNLISKVTKDPIMSEIFGNF